MHRERQNAYRLVIGQVILVLLAALLFGLHTPARGLSVVWGGVCCVVPGALFAWQLFRQMGAQRTRQALQAFYLGEVIKMVLIGICSLLVFKYAHVQPLEFFVGFGVAQFSFWILPPVLLRRQEVRQR